MRSPRVVQAYDRALLIVTALAIGFVTYNRVRPGGSATVSDLFVALAAVMLVPWLAASPSRIVPLPRWLWLSAGIFAIASILTSIFPAAPSRAALFFPGGPYSLLHGKAVVPPSNLGALLHLEIALVLVPFVIAQVATSWHRIWQLANVWIAGIVLGGIVGLIAYLANIHSYGLLGESAVVEVIRVRAFTMQPNVFGATAAMALPTAAALWITTAGRRRWYYAFAAAVLLTSVGLSGSRSSIFGVIIGVGVLAILDRRSRPTLIRAGIAVGAIALVIALVARGSAPVLQRVGGGAQVEVANNEREAIYTHVWSEVLHRPIVGHGFEYLRGSHDIYLQVSHAGGVIALLALLTLLFGVCCIAYRTSGESRRASLARALAASSLTWLLGTGIFEPAIYDRYLYVPIALLVACWAVRRQTAVDGDKPSPDGAVVQAT